MILTGRTKLDKKIARDCTIMVEHRNSLLPVLKRYKKERYKIIGLEQTSNSINLCKYEFKVEPTVLVVGHECNGIEQDVLDCLDIALEIPLFGRPHSLNVGVATSICLYEYAKQCNFGRV